jgi:hypothetical protein
MDCFCGPSGCILQVEIQVRKIYCINRATPTLPINLEDAARSEAEFGKAEQVCSMQIMCFVSPLYSENTQHCAPDFLPIIFRVISQFNGLTVAVIAGWREASACWSGYPLELQSY